MNIDYNFTVTSTFSSKQEHITASTKDVTASANKMLYVVMYFKKHRGLWNNTENHLYLDGLLALQDCVNCRDKDQTKKVISGRTTDEIAEAIQYERDHLLNI